MITTKIEDFQGTHVVFLNIMILNFFSFCGLIKSKTHHEIFNFHYY